MFKQLDNSIYHIKIKLKIRLFLVVSNVKEKKKWP